MVTKMDVNWLLGFFEGEGNFYIRFGLKNQVVSPQPIFQLRLAEKDLLMNIQHFLANQEIKANIYKIDANAEYRYKQFIKKPRTMKDHWVLQIGQRKSIDRLIEVLSSLQWHSKKLSSFEGWREALMLAYPRPLSKDRLIKIAEIATHLNGNSGRRIWTPQFVEEYCVEDKDGRVRLSNKTQE